MFFCQFSILGFVILLVGILFFSSIHFFYWISKSGKDLTAEWDRSGVKKGKEYAILTNEINKASFGLTTKQHKQFNGLKKESLLDNMTMQKYVRRIGNN